MNVKENALLNVCLFSPSLVLSVRCSVTKLNLGYMAAESSTYNYTLVLCSYVYQKAFAETKSPWHLEIFQYRAKKY